MYYLIGEEGCLRNLVILATTHGRGPVASIQDLKAAYRVALLTLQPDVPRSATRLARVVSDPALEARLMAPYQVASRLNDKLQSQIFADTRTDGHQLDEWLASFRGQYPAYFRLFDLVVTDVITPGSDRAGGGTTSAGIGIVWINARAGWTGRDALEALIHETTHNLMFVDEQCHGHYRDYELMTSPAHFVQSAILGERRPLDKALHSLVVASELLAAREALELPATASALHPASDRLRRQAAASAADIARLDAETGVLAARGRELLALCTPLSLPENKADDPLVRIPYRI